MSSEKRAPKFAESCDAEGVTLEEFQRSGNEPPGLTPALRALWQDAKGKWDEAHRIAQEDNSREAAWVHAYLHRKEGDLSNARYWYARAGRAAYPGSLEEEWRDIVRSLLTLRAPDEQQM
jgi:hypothetical protein